MSKNVTASKPWDARIANWLVRPLSNSAITPNHLTTIRAIVGLAGVWELSQGAFASGAWLVSLSNFLDHTDGELARITGKGSRFGHMYDLISDAVITCGTFLGLGIGVTADTGNTVYIWMGAIAGIAVAAIFHMRHDMENRLGKCATQQVNFAGFEAEDILYLLPLVALCEIEATFVHVAAIGAAIAAFVVGVLFLRSRSATT